MKAMICEMCGNNNLIKQDGVYVCQYCGTKYSVEEAKKLIGAVTIDRSEETKKMLVLARRARENNNSANAEKYYSMVLQDDPENWEATFFQVYYQAKQCTIAEISSAAISIQNIIPDTLRLIAALENETDRDAALDTVIHYSVMVACDLASGAIIHYSDFMNVSGAKDECSYRVAEAKLILDTLEGSIKNYCKDDNKLIGLLKEEITFIHTDARPRFFKNDYLQKETERLVLEIKKLDSSYTPPQNIGYFAATAKSAIAKSNKLSELKKEVRTVQAAKNQKNKLNEDNRANYKKVLCFSMLACCSCIVMAFSLSLFVLLFLFGIIGLSVFGNKSWKNSKRIKLLKELIEKWDEIEPINSKITTSNGRNTSESV